MADCESEVIRDKSRGLEGGAFFNATLLNRKEAKTCVGKTGIDYMKDFYLLKSDVRFLQYFIWRFNLNVEEDNTPAWLKTRSAKEKVKYMHDLVATTLRELLLYFEDSSLETDTATQLLDHPLR